MKYNFTVVISDDSTITSRAKIDITDKQHAIPMKVKKGVKRSIFPKETKELYRILPSGKKLSGIPADSCWLFKSVTGKINVYSSLAELGYTYITAIQNGDDGPIVPLTKKNLEAIIGTPENPRVLKLLEKNKLSQAIELFNGGAK